MTEVASALQSIPDAPGLQGELLEKFPLAVALVRAGHALAGNEALRRLQSEMGLSDGEIAALAGTPGEGWFAVRDGAGHDEGLRACKIQFATGVAVILEQAQDAAAQDRVRELEAQVQELEQLSATDLLTGVWNRRHFERMAETERLRSIRQRQPVSLALIDIDHFKNVNDRFGHSAGDLVLREAAELIRQHIRAIDAVFRWGGDEFVVIATGASHRAGHTMAERLLHAFRRHEFGAAGRLSISIGVAEHVEDELLPEWFERLDRALYRAKQAGRDGVWVDARGVSDSWRAEESQLSAVRLVWREAYACGDQAIDHQHRELFDLANAALDAFSEYGPGDTALVAMDQLIAHVVSHFAHEEQELEARGYAEAAAHKQMHAALIERALQLRAAIAGAYATMGELLNFIVDKVVANHLFTADRKFFPIFEDDERSEARGQEKAITR